MTGAITGSILNGSSHFARWTQGFAHARVETAD
jgi:hypothetical protein